MEKIEMIVDDIVENSIAQEIGIKKNDRIISINNQYPKDIIEYSFLVNDEQINLLVEHRNEKLERIELEEYEIEKDFDEDLGIIFKSAVLTELKDV